MFKKGDTLVEVALAVGIFSMVAIAVAAVLSGSTSGAQTALETTVTREEIDTQAEALRFVQTSYAVDRNSTQDNKFYDLWQAVTSNPYDVSDTDDPNVQEFLNYAPTSCDAAYQTAAVQDHAFVVNPRALGEYTTEDSTSLASDSVITRFSTGKLQPATIYPRLVYRNSASAANSETQDSLIDSNTDTELYRAEGVYVVAVRDQKTTEVVDFVDGAVGNEAAFYDFYIRSCWYGTDSDQPSTISTVIRLYDPDVLQSGGYVIVKYNPHTDGKNTKYYEDQRQLRKVTTHEVTGRLGWTFDWVVNSASSGSGYSAGATIKPGTAITNDQPSAIEITLRPQWTHTQYRVKYHPTGNPPYAGYTPNAIGDRICYQDEGCTITLASSEIPTASGYKLAGWCSVNPNGGSCPNGKTYNTNTISFPAGTTFPVSAFSGSNRTLDLYPIWRENNEVLNVHTSWASNTDYDSYMKILKPGTSNTYIAASWSTTTNESLKVTYSGETYYLVTGQGDGRGNINGRYYEDFIVKTLGSRSYYYSIKNWSRNGYIGNDITVKVTGDQGTSAEFKSTVRNNCNYWNVFAYKDGKIIQRDTCTESQEYGY